MIMAKLSFGDYVKLLYNNTGQVKFLGKNLSGSSETLFRIAIPVNNYIDEAQPEAVYEFRLARFKVFR